MDRHGPPQPPRPDARHLLNEHVARSIVADIAARSLRVGDEISGEAELAERHGVNRLAVREAIRALTARGVLASHQGKRATVASPSAALLADTLRFRISQETLDVTDVLDTRGVIECELARRAASRAGSNQPGLEALRTALAAMRASHDDRDAFIEHDLAFHGAIAELSGARLLAFMLESMNDVLREVRRASYDGLARRSADQASTLAAHQAILDAIARAAPEEAARAMRAHLEQIPQDLAPPPAGS